MRVHLSDSAMQELAQRARASGLGIAAEAAFTLECALRGIRASDVVPHNFNAIERAARRTDRAGEPQTGTKGPRLFTQADIDRIAENERKKAKRQYERELAAQRPETTP